MKYSIIALLLANSASAVKLTKQTKFDEFHPILPDPLHNARVLEIQSVAGPDITDQIGASVHNASMEGGEPNPEQRRNILRGKDNHDVPLSEPAWMTAEREFKAKGEAIKAEEAKKKAEEEAKEKKEEEMHAARTKAIEDGIAKKKENG